MLQKNVKSPAGAGAKSSTSKASGKGSKSWNGNGTGKRKKSGQEKGKTQPQTSKSKGKGKSSGKGKHVKSQSAQGKRKGQRQKQERFHRWRIEQRLEKCTLRQSQSHRRTRYKRCFEHLVGEAGMSCLYSCHQWHRVEEAVHFGLPMSRSVCRLNSCHAPCIPWPVVWLVGTHNAKHRFRGRELPDLSLLTQAIRDTENKLRWRVKLGLNDSERLGFASMMNMRVVPRNASQDPEVEQVIRFFPGPENVVYRSDRESKSPETEVPKKTLLSERTRTHSFSTQTDERTRTDSDPK